MLTATLQVLGEILPQLHGEAVAKRWGADLGITLPAPGDDTTTWVSDGFLDAVAARAGVPGGHGREQARVCCQALARWSDGGTLSRLRLGLPEPLHVLFEPEERGAPLHAEAHRISRSYARATLAEGRPGSMHAVGDSAGIMHRHSVAAAGEPSKLSSAGALPAEEERRTLAVGRPSAGRPVSETG